jgi:large exoprotein involved in heme utilization and adhesion
VETGAQGNAGNINVRSRFFSIRNGAQIQTVTRGQGNAGSIRVEATDQVTVIGRSPDNNVASGLFSSAEETAVGQGGNVEIITPELQISDGAGINARGVGENAAGSINIDATGDITLNNQAVLSAETASGTEGNINLRSDNLFLRNNSRITTDANGTATGGNITIDTNFVVARNNSDINANAEQNSGGQVIINAQGIFGTEFREGVFNTPDSDITATSKLGLQFSGTVQLNTPDVDPTAGLIALPENVIDPSALIAQNVCFQSATSQFIITGRGGLPPNPNDSVNADFVQVDLVAPAPINSGQVQPIQNPQSLTQSVPKPIPAQGWVFNENGEVVLTAESHQNLRQNVRATPSNFTCE